jgi:adenylate cyclase
MHKEKFEQFSDLLNQHLNTPGYLLTEIYNDLGLSRPQLSRLVKDQTGLTLSLYIRRRRLERARNLLYTTELRIVEIADAVGIDSPQSFTKYFTQEFGLSPTEYRRQFQLSELIAESPATEDLPAELADNSPPPSTPAPTADRWWQWALGGLLLLILVTGLYLSLRPDAEVKIDQDASIAILPFTYRGDPADSLLAEGLYDQVYASLASIEQLTVIAKRSSGLFRNSPKTLPQIARELGVRYLLTGSIVAQSQQLQVSVELVEAAESRTVWARTFGGTDRGSVAHMNALARQISEELDQKLSPDESRKLDRLPTQNMEAYREYLRGVHLLKTRSEEKIRLGITYFDRALALDSTFADALASRGMAYYLLGNDGYMELFKGFQVAEQNALSAIRLDPENGLAYATLGLCYWRLNKPEQALTTYQIALLHSPNDAIIHYWYSLALRSMGRFEEAIRAGNRALELDPLYPTILVGHVGNYTAAGRYEEARRLIEESKPILEGFFMYYYVRAFYHLNRQNYREAMKEFTKSDSLYPGNRQIETYQLYCRARLGDRAPAEALLRQLTDAPDEYVYKAILSAGLLDRETCLRYLELGAPLGIAPEYLKISPIYRFLHGDPRFEAVLQQLGLSGPV